MIKKIKESLNKIDVYMMLKCARNPYLWDWWMLVRNPLTYLIIGIFLIIIYFAA